MNFTGKTAFVTGVAHGIGKAIALGLAKNGASLFLCDINGIALKAAAEEAHALGADVEYETLDVSDEKAVNTAVQNAVSRFGKIDILINNAGIYDTHIDFKDSNSADRKKKININILGTMYPTRALLAHMVSNGYGRIINISSVAGVYGISSMTDYAMTKGAVIAFTKSLAKETAMYGVTVNAVSPGSIAVSDADMPEHSFTGRAGTPEECANVVLFLASDEASYVSGQNYLVDGCRKKM